MTQKFVALPREVVERTLDTLGNAETVSREQYEAELFAITALRAALEQSQVEQEPVAATLAFYEGEREPRLLSWNRLPNGEHRLYTHPQNLRCKSNQKRLATLWGYVKAEPLTDEQIAAATGAKPGTPTWLVAVAFTRAVEASHNIK